MDVFGTDYPTPDGSCVRDYVHVSDLAQAHLDALRYLRGGGDSPVSNIGYGNGFSVLQVIDAVKKVSGVDFEVRLKPRRGGDPARSSWRRTNAPGRCSAGRPATTALPSSFVTHWPGSRS